MEGSRATESEALTSSQHGLHSNTQENSMPPEPQGVNPEEMRYKIEDTPAWYLCILLGFQVR